MDPGQVRLERDLHGSGLESVDPVQLVRPRHAIRQDVPFPTADVRDALRVVERRAAVLEVLDGVGERRRARTHLLLETVPALSKGALHPLALPDRRCQDERGRHRDRDEGEQNEERAVLVAGPERSQPLDRPPERERGHEERRRRRPARAEPDRRPHEGRNDPVGERVALRPHDARDPHGHEPERDRLDWRAARCG